VGALNPLRYPVAVPRAQAGNGPGDKVSPLAGHTRDLFRQSGLAHLTAANGRNLGLLLALWFAVLPRCLRTEPLRTVLSLSVIVGYTILVSASASIVRATVMLTVTL
jgi:predicted membrane metal-binding protein